MKILSVDDDPTLLELLSAVLASIGQTEVTTAESAAKAFSILKNTTEPFDCFLLDIQMPDIDGIQLCKAIRLMPEYRRTPILMITAMSDKAYIDKAFTAGATDYISKPFNVVELSARINTVASLTEAWQQNTKSTVTTDICNGYPNAEKPYTLSEKLHIDDVDGVIDHTAIENYVSKLSRNMMFGVKVLAFSIVDIERIFRSASAFDFHALITDVAEAVTYCLKRSQFLVAYAGNGTFVCVIGLDGKIPTEMLEEELQEIITSMDLCYSDGRSIILSITAGEPIGLTFRFGENVTKSLVQVCKSSRNRAENRVSIPAKKPLLSRGIFGSLLG